MNRTSLLTIATIVLFVAALVPSPATAVGCTENLQATCDKVVDAVENPPGCEDGCIPPECTFATFATADPTETGAGSSRLADLCQTVKDLEVPGVDVPEQCRDLLFERANTAGPLLLGEACEALGGGDEEDDGGEEDLCPEEQQGNGCCDDSGKTGGNPWRDPVECEATCGPGTLTINAVVDDTTEIWGAFACGSSEAKCVRNTKTCAGEGVSTRNGNGDCWAETNDFWASKTTVLCLNIGPALACTGRESVPTLSEMKNCSDRYTCDELESVAVCTDDQTGKTYVCVGPQECKEIPLKAASAQPVSLNATPPVLSARLIASDGFGGISGMVCESGECRVVAPTCALSETGFRRCWL